MLNRSKKTGTSKAPAKKSAAKAATNFEPITVQMSRLYNDDGTRNEDPSEIIDVVGFPEGVPYGRISVTLGASADYGAAKASVTVTVPTTLEEQDNAKTFAFAKAQEYFDEIAGSVADADGEGDAEDEADEEVEEKPKRKRSAKKEEPEEDDADEDESEDAEDGDDEEEISEEDIRAMKRPQLEAFNDEQDLGLDADDYKKNAKGLTEFQDAVIEALSGDGEDADEDGEDADDADEDESEDAEDGDDGEAYEEDELNDMDLDDILAICKEWKIKPPKAKSDKAKKLLAIKAILKAQEEA